jgi:hypothetical protein
MTDDRHPFLTLNCSHCGHALKVKLGCGDRTCPECRLKWFGYHFKTLLSLVAGWKSAYFLTLTLKNIPEIGRSDVQRIRKCFNSLRRRFKLILGGFYVVQATNRGKGWHLHLHVLFDGSFISQKALSEAWAEITGGSFIVDIRKVGDPRTAVRYLLSDFLQAPRIRPQDVEEFNGIFKGSRLVQPFGKYKATKFPRVPFKCPGCGRVEWVVLDVLLGEKRCFHRGREGEDP